MKRLAFPLIAAAPFLFALAPHADAAAITTHRPSLSPLRLSTAPVKRRFNYGVAAAPVQSNRPAPAARTAESLDAMLGGAVQSNSGGMLDLGFAKTGSGTLQLDGSNSSFGSVNVTSGSISTGVSGATVVLNGATLSAGRSGSGFIQDLTTAGHSAVSLTSSSVEFTTTAIETGRWVISAPDHGTVLVQGDGTAPLDRTGVGTLTLIDLDIFNTSEVIGNLTGAIGGTITLGPTMYLGNGGLLTKGAAIRNTGGLLVGDPTLTTLPVLDFGSFSGAVSQTGGITLGNGRLGLIGGGIIFVRQPDGTWQAANVSGGNSNLVVNGAQTVDVASSAAPVPEPGTAMLFALGMLAASQVRRRAV